MAKLHSIRFWASLCQIVFVALAIGCAPTATTVITPPEPTVEENDESSAESTADAEAAIPKTVISQIQALSDEVRSLRDQVEVLEIELNESRQRQNDLYDDLDARLRKIERMSPPSSDLQSGDGADSSDTTTAAAAESETEPGTIETDETSAAVDEVIEEEPEYDPEVVREIYDSAFRTLRQGKYDDAIVEFSALVENYPSSDLVDDALYWIAEANYVTKKYDVALMGFEQILSDYPKNRRVAEITLKIGYIYYDQEEYEQAENYLLQVMDKYPASRSAFSAQRRLTKMKRDGNL